MNEINFNVWREGAKVHIDVAPFSNVKLVLRFTNEFDSGELTAEAYYRLIRDGMRARVLAIRRNAYGAGYRDGRGKNKKREHFFGCINTEG